MSDTFHHANAVRPALIIIRGLPGSGKSTLARVFADAGYEHIEADDYFMQSGEYRFIPADLPKAHAACLARCESILSSGYPCVVANTFTRRWEYAPYVALADRLGLRYHIIEACGNWPNIHGVPAESIERMRDRWESTR